MRLAELDLARDLLAEAADGLRLVKLDARERRRPAFDGPGAASDKFEVVDPRRDTVGDESLW